MCLLFSKSPRNLHLLESLKTADIATILGIAFEEMTLGQFSLRVLRFCPFSLIHTVLHTHSFMYYRYHMELALESFTKKHS
jgi:hypothetical protein